MKKGYGWVIYWAAVFVFACSPVERDVPAGGGVMVEVPDGHPVVALTFDDGPHAENTRRLLDELARHLFPGGRAAGGK